MRHLKSFKLFESQEIIDTKKFNFQSLPYDEVTKGIDDWGEKAKKWEDYYNGFIERVSSEKFKGGLEVADTYFSEEDLLYMLKGYVSYYDSSLNTALSELIEHLYTAIELWKSGGKLYRLIYANSEEDIDKDNLGHHWTISEYEIDTLRGRGWKDMYGKGNKPFLVIIETEPKNVSVKNVDIHGNPEEKEINIIDISKIRIKDIKEL